MKAADLLSLSRMPLAGLMAAAAALGSLKAAALLYLLALATDVLDGIVARRQGPTGRGAVLDILGDNALALGVAASLALLRPWAVERELWRILLLSAHYAAAQAACLLLRRRPFAMKTLSSTLAAVAFPFAAAGLAFGISSLIYPYLLLQLYSVSEKAALTLARKSDLLALRPRWIAAFLILAVLLLSAALLLPGRDPRVCFASGTCVRAEVRASMEERALGLMFRPGLAPDEGMLFVFEEDAGNAFWMRNMRFSIDIIFIDSDWRVVSVSEGAVPCTAERDEDCELYRPAGIYRYVLEVPAGFASANGVVPGQPVAASGPGVPR